jgi:outer membrane biosynthesis protein TonB
MSGKGKEVKDSTDVEPIPEEFVLNSDTELPETTKKGKSGAQEKEDEPEEEGEEEEKKGKKRKKSPKKKAEKEKETSEPKEKKEKKEKKGKKDKKEKEGKAKKAKKKAKTSEAKETEATSPTASEEATTPEEPVRTPVRPPAPSRANRAAVRGGRDAGIRHRTEKPPRIDSASIVRLMLRAGALYKYKDTIEESRAIIEEVIRSILNPATLLVRSSAKGRQTITERDIVTASAWLGLKIYGFGN